MTQHAVEVRGAAIFVEPAGCYEAVNGRVAPDEAIQIIERSLSIGLREGMTFHKDYITGYLWKATD